MDYIKLFTLDIVLLRPNCAGAYDRKEEMPLARGFHSSAHIHGSVLVLVVEGASHYFASTLPPFGV